MLTHFHVSNYKNLQDFSTPIFFHTTVIGLPNSGKTSFLEAIEFMAAICTGKGVEWLEDKKYCFNDVVTVGKDEICFEATFLFKNPITVSFIFKETGVEDIAIKVLDNKVEIDSQELLVQEDSFDIEEIKDLQTFLKKIYVPVKDCVTEESSSLQVDAYKAVMSDNGTNILNKTRYLFPELVGFNVCHGHKNIVVLQETDGENIKNLSLSNAGRSLLQCLGIAFKSEQPCALIDDLDFLDTKVRKILTNQSICVSKEPTENTILVYTTSEGVKAVPYVPTDNLERTVHLLKHEIILTLSCFAGQGRDFEFILPLYSDNESTFFASYDNYFTCNGFHKVEEIDSGYTIYNTGISHELMVGEEFIFGFKEKEVFHFLNKEEMEKVLEPLSESDSIENHVRSEIYHFLGNNEKYEEYLAK